MCVCVGKLITLVTVYDSAVLFRLSTSCVMCLPSGRRRALVVAVNNVTPCSQPSGVSVWSVGTSPSC